MTPDHVHNFNPYTFICSCGATPSGNTIDWDALARLADAVAEVQKAGMNPDQRNMLRMTNTIEDLAQEMYEMHRGDIARLRPFFAQPRPWDELPRNLRAGWLAAAHRKFDCTATEGTDDVAR
jgi:hypothetical protein